MLRPTRTFKQNMLHGNPTSAAFVHCGGFKIVAATCCAVVLFAGCGKQKSDSQAQSTSGQTQVSSADEANETSSPTNVTSLEPLQLANQSTSSSESAVGTQSIDPEPIAAVQPIALRIPDNRPELNEARLQAAGIRMLQSKRLILLTDLPEESVARFPRIADQLFDHLESHFGPLPPSPDGSEFQVTGCIIGDVARFQTTGLMPEPEFGFTYGRHRDYQFWMFDQASDYYRRHLMLHEFTHCFMTCETTMLDIPPRWYIEGMAEFFATHSVAADGSSQFGILPPQAEGFEGWGRVAELSRLFERFHKPTATPEVFAVEPLAEVIRDVVWSEKESDYAKWWAISWLLHSNPAYGPVMDTLKPLRRRDEFMAAEASIRQQLGKRLDIDWLLFAETLEPGFDVDRSFPVHRPDAEVLESPPETVELRADRDWQQSGFRLAAGESVVVKCEGRFSVNEPAEQWESEPQGISVEYVRGFPIGCVVATLVAADGQSLTHRLKIGREAKITATQDAELWMQVNDSSDSRQNNSGSVKVSFFISK